MEALDNLRRLYDILSPELDPNGFRLFAAAQEVTGIRHLWEEFPYEDARGLFAEADGRQLLKYLAAAHFNAVSWEVVPGTTCEKAVLHDVPRDTEEYQAFEKALYETALRHMESRTPSHRNAKELTEQNILKKRGIENGANPISGRQSVTSR